MRNVALILAVLSFPLAASAARDGQFGSRGTIAPSGSISLYTSHTGNTNQTILSLNPMAFVFVVDNLAVGGGLGLTWSKPENGDSSTMFSLTPSVGYNFRVSDAFSIFPYAGIGYTRGSWGGNNGVTLSSVDLSINVPFLAHFGNFYLGGGPFLSTELMSDYESGGTSMGTDKTTTFGLGTMIGGWF